LGMRDVAAGDAAGLLLVEALGQLHALMDVGAGRVKRAHGTRELPHLEEELHGEGAEGRARELPVGDAAPERVAAERAPCVDHRPELLDEPAAGRHGRTSTPLRRSVSTPRLSGGGRPPDRARPPAPRRRAAPDTAAPRRRALRARTRRPAGARRGRWRRARSAAPDTRGARARRWRPAPSRGAPPRRAGGGRPIAPGRSARGRERRRCWSGAAWWRARRPAPRGRPASRRPPRSG